MNVKTLLVRNIAKTEKAKSLLFRKSLQSINLQKRKLSC